MSDYQWKLTVRHKGYDAAQPRIPAGQSGGGRWTSGGTFYTASDHVRARAEDVGEESIREFAHQKGISYEEAARQIFDRLEDDLENPIVMRRSVGSSMKILEEDGRFKSQFETGKSAGMFDPKYRTKAEYSGLGIPANIDDKLRPLYGAVGVEQSNLNSYGSVEWVFKESVKERSTITLGDSLGDFAYENMIGEPYLSPGKAAFDRAADYYGRMGVKAINYIEVQVQGGLNLKDVVGIRLHKGRFTGPDYFTKLIELSKQKGIEVKVHEWSP